MYIHTYTHYLLSSYRLLLLTELRTTFVLAKDALVHLHVSLRIDCCFYHLVYQVIFFLRVSVPHYNTLSKYSLSCSTCTVSIHVKYLTS